MKTILTTLNAKFIHTALAIRWLYVACKDHFNIDFKEYTIKESQEAIVRDLLAQQPDVIAFSCYIWNIEVIEELCCRLKSLCPHLIIIYGGPEVTYEPKYFLEHAPVDYVMSGEGEKTFPQLLEQLEKGLTVNVEGVSYRGHITSQISQVDLADLESLPSPYQLVQDEKEKAHRILYFETSRGCPFQCQYCLSSLEKGLRFFSRDYLIKQLDAIVHSSAKMIKILDRSFNANVAHARFILEYLFTHYREGQQFQFEINADVFAWELVELINQKAPKGLLRFEIGIQSTYEPTNRAVKRMQNFSRLTQVVRALQEGGKCDLHLDLIAGLPYENYARFAQSFDEVFAFRAKELQLGFLKLLRGTSLRIEAQTFGYEYDQHSPYDISCSSWLEQEDIVKIHMVEDMLEKYWNSARFPKTMKAIMDDVPSAFDFFYRLACFYQKQNFPLTGFQPYHLCDCLNQFTHSQYFLEILQDYFENSKIKPKRWYKTTLTNEQRHAVVEKLADGYGYSRDTLYRYAYIEAVDQYYIVAVFRYMTCSCQLINRRELDDDGMGCDANRSTTEY